jgi:ribulose-phosphate 3-epimerase
MRVLVSASILNSDLANLEHELRRVEDAGADMIHIDVMDGVFTESITFGDYVTAKMRPHSRLPFDTHLMVSDPTRLIPLFAKAGSDYITIHEESDCDVAACLKHIRSLGVKAGISLNPATDITRIFEYLPLCDLVLIMSVVPGKGGQAFMDNAPMKIKAVREEADRLGLNLHISVDGGINEETAKLIFDAGANIAVVGSYLTSSEDMVGAVLSIRCSVV